MNINDTELNYGGMLRCCIDTIATLPDGDYQDGEYDCMHEPKGNKAILLKDGVWQWNQAVRGGLFTGDSDHEHDDRI